MLRIKSYLRRLIVHRHVAQFGLSQLETVVSITLISDVMTEASECVVPSSRVQTPELALVKVCACASSRCADLASSQQSRLLKWTRLFCFASRTYYAADCWQQNNLTSTLEKYEIDTPWVSVYDCSVRSRHIIREGRRQIIEDMIVLKTVVSLQMQPAYHFCSY